MRNIISALFFCSLCVAGQSITAHAQAPAVKKIAPLKTAAPNPAVAPLPPAEEKSPIKLIYAANYDGNKLGASMTQTPTGDSAAITHDFRVGYQVHKSHVIGVREKVTQNLMTTAAAPETFIARDWRVYMSWANMIETPDIEMAGRLDVMLPTSDGSKLKGKIFGLNLVNSWTYKTSLRNWSFNLVTIVSPGFYQDPTGKSNYGLTAIPNITVDIGPKSHIYVELDLDTTHDYDASFFEFNEADPDYFTIGPQFDLNSHITLYPAMKFFTGSSWKGATVYIDLTVAL